MSHLNTRKPSVRAAVLAAQWAQQIGLPAGTLWEPPIARNILRDYERLQCWHMVETSWRMRLGLSLTEPRQP